MPKVCEDHDITVDSGASASVMPPELAKDYKTKPSYHSKRGTSFKTASKQLVKVEGEKRLSVITHNGQHHKLRFDVGPVNKPLLSVSEVSDSGWDVVFSNTRGNYAVNPKTGEKLWFYRTAGVYKLEAWKKPPPESERADLSPVTDDEGFRRQPPGGEA